MSWVIQALHSQCFIGYQPGKQEWWKRYYNIFTKGKMPFGLQSYESGDVVGQEFEDFYNETNGTPGVSLDAQQSYR